MTDTLLITSADIAKIRSITLTGNMTAMLTPHIRSAQDSEIRKALGDVMYTDLMNNSSAQKYVDLLGGLDYTNLDNKTVTFRGLKWALAYFAWARYIEDRTSQDTPSGMRVKVNDYSEAPSSAEIKSKVGQARLDGSEYLRHCIEFIKTFPLVYTLYANDCTTSTNNTASFKMRTI